MAIKIKAVERKLKFTKDENDPGVWRYVMQPDLYIALTQDKVIKEAALRSGVAKECTAEPTLLCTLLDFADDAEADTRQATDLSDAGAKVFQLFDDEDTARTQRDRPSVSLKWAPACSS